MQFAYNKETSQPFIYISNWKSGPYSIINCLEVFEVAFHFCYALARVIAPEDL